MVQMRVPDLLDVLLSAHVPQAKNALASEKQPKGQRQPGEDGGDFSLGEQQQADDHQHSAKPNHDDGIGATSGPIFFPDTLSEIMQLHLALARPLAERPQEFLLIRPLLEDVQADRIQFVIGHSSARYRTRAFIV